MRLVLIACLATGLATAPAGVGQAAPAGADLSGVWTNSSITTLERTDPSLPLVLSDEQTDRLERTRASQEEAANAPTSASEGAPAVGGAIGGYNTFWLDRGMHAGRVRGEARSSWIIDPPSGRMPVSDAGKKRIADILARRSFDDPEGLNPADRCLVGSRGSGGPPMLNNIYNNTYRFVQTPDHVVIEVEMMHDARIIPIGGTHRPSAVHQWLGDSVGRWEGPTLVVETRNWNPQHGSYEPVFLSEKAIVTERFTRVAPDEMLYQFEISDPVYYTQTWKGEMTLGPAGGEVYEFACHEGNYAMAGILAGARREDKLKKR
jgi:hypothetical protein